MVGLPKILGDSWEDSEALRLELRNPNPNANPNPNSNSNYNPNPAVGGNRQGIGIVTQKFFPVKGDRLYFRVSAAAYNSLQEFHVLRDVINDIAARKLQEQNIK